MATTPKVLGNVPLEFTDPNSGKQISIPLSALFFDPTKNNQLSIDSNKWPDPRTTPVTLPGFVASLLADLAQQRLIVPAPVPSPKLAMIITATDPGSAGNGIKVTITSTPNADPTQTTFTIQIDETDTYTGLKLASISSVLGTDKAAGSTPGLAHVVQGTLAGSGLPGVVTTRQNFSGSPSAQSEVKDNTQAHWVTLEAKKPGADGTQTSLTIANVDTTKNTFDLSLYWAKSISGITLATLATNLASLGYEIAAAAPKGIFSVPAAGVVQLTGGADGPPASAASAIIFAGQ